MPTCGIHRDTATGPHESTSHQRPALSTFRLFFFEEIKRQGRHEKNGPAKKGGTLGVDQKSWRPHQSAAERVGDLAAVGHAYPRSRLSVRAQSISCGVTKVDDRRPVVLCCRYRRQRQPLAVGTRLPTLLRLARVGGGRRAQIRCHGCVRRSCDAFLRSCAPSRRVDFSCADSFSLSSLTGGRRAGRSRISGVVPFFCFEAFGSSLSLAGTCQSITSENRPGAPAAGLFGMQRGVHVRIMDRATRKTRGQWPLVPRKMDPPIQLRLDLFFPREKNTRE